VFQDDGPVKKKTAKIVVYVYPSTICDRSRPSGSTRQQRIAVWPTFSCYGNDVRWGRLLFKNITVQCIIFIVQQTTHIHCDFLTSWSQIPLPKII